MFPRANFSDISFPSKPEMFVYRGGYFATPTPTPSSGDIGDRWINGLWLNLHTNMQYTCGIRYDDLDQPKTVRLNNSPILRMKYLNLVWVY
jgi:hypothetical protein